MRICPGWKTLVSNSDLDWTIVRPAGLFDTPTVTHYQVAQRIWSSGERKTSRADLAISCSNNSLLTSMCIRLWRLQLFSNEMKGLAYALLHCMLFH